MNREGEPPKVSIGFVVGLDYADARLSVHDVLQEFKLHPLVRQILEGGKRVAWGAKAIPEGGYWAMPRLHAPGMVICGDAAGMVNVPRLKGIHYAIRSGMLAAETIYRQLKAGSTDFSGYETAVYDSEIGKDLWESRNMKQPFASGLVVGGAITNAMVVTKGRLPGGHWATHRDADQPLMLTDRESAIPSPTASTRSTSSRASSSPATRRATTRRATSGSSSACRASWPRPGSGCARPASTRCRRTRRRRARRPDRQPLQLRAVRGDHRQGRAPHAARGRRRAGVPGDIAQLRARPAVVKSGVDARALAARPPRSCCRARPPRGPSRVVACVPALRSGLAPRAPTVRGARRAARGSDACRCASRCRCARAAPCAGARRRPGLRHLADLGRRRAPLHLRQDDREPRRAGRYRMVVRFRWLDGTATCSTRHARARPRCAASPTCARTSCRRGSSVAPGRRGATGAATSSACATRPRPRRAVRASACARRAPARGRRRPGGRAPSTVVSFAGAACTAGEPVAVTVDPPTLSTRRRGRQHARRPLPAGRRAARDR